MKGYSPRQRKPKLGKIANRRGVPLALSRQASDIGVMKTPRRMPHLGSKQRPASLTVPELSPRAAPAAPPAEAKSAADIQRDEEIRRMLEAAYT